MRVACYVDYQYFFTDFCMVVVVNVCYICIYIYCYKIVESGGFLYGWVIVFVWACVLYVLINVRHDFIKTNHSTHTKMCVCVCIILFVLLRNKIRDTIYIYIYMSYRCLFVCVF